jgi:hypothetical protein
LGKFALLRLIGIDGVCDKNRGAEKSHQYGGKLNHGTHPYARPALIHSIAIAARLFQDDFVVPGKWFRP